ncbi:AAA family ATPase [Salinibacter altiplanensis]|uniref:AAA family ATPase n=1 Tax=Salinibacter altiplanensis TaxID=1803181 RepID=UPI000C9F0D54|nr:AAA family ATPase [Salinibacter altiplanensis]
MSEDSFPEDLPPAYFLSLTLENVRCFGPEQTLDLTDEEGRPAQWTVLLGNNGTGKTTLLEALGGIATAFEKYGDVESSGQLENLFFTGIDFFREVRAGDRDALVGGEYVLGRALPRKVQRNRESENFKFRKSRSKREAGFQFVDGNIPSSQETRGFQCRGYGATRRMDKRVHYEKEESTAIGNLREEAAKLPNVEEWLLRTDHAAKSEKPKAKRRLEQIEGVLANPESGILPDVDDLRFAKQEGDTSPPRVEFHTLYGWVTIDQLSLGYRTMIAWVVDLACRLFEHYPESANPLAEPAVCLVDEIDLHLHPKWQRKIIDFLSDRFPNTQFIVTAHSPLVVQAAQDANIALMRRVEVEDGDDYVEIHNDMEPVGNLRVDQILTSDLYGLESARPPQLDGLLEERQEILSSSELTEEDEKRLDEIEEEIGDLPSGETKEQREAMDFIKDVANRLEKEGETIS